MPTLASVWKSETNFKRYSRYNQQRWEWRNPKLPWTAEFLSCPTDWRWLSLDFKALICNPAWSCEEPVVYLSATLPCSSLRLCVIEGCHWSWHRTLTKPPLWGASPLLKTNQSEQALTCCQLSCQGSKEAKHRQAAIELFGPNMETPACISLGDFHLRFFGVDVVMTFKILGDKTSRLLDGESGCCHGCLRGGPLMCRST